MSNKSLFHSLCLILGFSAYVVGCKSLDEHDSPLPETYVESSYEIPPETKIDVNDYDFLHNSIYAQISQSNGMLAFADSNHFKAVIEDLELHGIANGQDTILTLFENHFHITSLRKTINNNLDRWLETQGYEMDYNLSPDNHFVDDEYVRAILNPLGEVKIGTPIYKIWEDGLIFQITNGDLATLAILREAYPSTERLPDNIVIENLPENGGGDVRNANCKDWKGTDWYPETIVYLTVERKIECKVLARNYLFTSHYVKSKMKAFDWINGTWRKADDVPMTCSVFGEVLRGTCTKNTPTPVANEETGTRHKVVAKRGKLGKMRIEREMVSGRFEFPEPNLNPAIILTIDW